jgi:hypothetical protein
MLAHFKAPYAPSAARRVSAPITLILPRESRPETNGRSAEPGGRPQATAADRLAFCRAYGELRAARWADRDNAVPLSALRASGLSEPLVLRMLYHAHVEHCLSPTGRPADSLRLSPASLFVLTDAGEAFAALFLGAGSSPRTEAALAAAWERFSGGDLVPRYDGAERAFCWGPYRLKSFRQPSVNQELVLLTAEELRWPVWFDDPLPKRSGRSAKVRLHDTIKDLNRRQTPPLIHFKGDGTGTRIGWEYR